MRVARQDRGFQLGGQCPRLLDNALPNVLQLLVRADAVGPDDCCRSVVAGTVLFSEHSGEGMQLWERILNKYELKGMTDVCSKL